MENEEKKKKNKNKFLRVVGWIFLSLLILVIAILLFVRSPWGQGIIVDKVVSSIEKTTGTNVDIEKLFITFDGNILLKGLFIEDKQGDTLIYSKYLEADIPLIPIIRGKGISIDFLEWEGVVANIVRNDSVSGFNYQFIVDAYATADTTAAPQDTAAAPMQISLGDLNFSNLNVSFNDDVGGINSKLILDRLEVEMEETDLENMRFHISKAELENTNFKYTQTKPFPPPETEDTAALPFIKVDNIVLKNVFADYSSEPDGLSTVVEIGNFTGDSGEINLDQSIIDIKEVALVNSDILLELTTTVIDSTSTEATTQNTSNDESPNFEWPIWKVNVEAVALENIDFSYFVDGAEVVEGKFDPNAVVLKDLDFKAENILLKEEAAGMHLKKFNFKTASGLALNQFNFDLEITEDILVLESLDFKLNENELHGNLSLNYDSLQQLINSPEKVSIEGEFSEIDIHLKDIFPFQPELKKNEYLVALSEKPISGNLKIDGSLSSLEISSADFNWGANTSLSASGTVQNSLDPENLRFDFPSIKLSSRRSDLQKLIKEEDLGIKIPERISLNGSLKGNPEDISTNAFLRTSEGNIKLNGNFSSLEGLVYNADLEVEDLQLGNLLGNDQLGSLDFNLKTSGSGDNVNQLDATLEATIAKFEFNDYVFENISLQGELEDGKGLITSSYKDKNLNADLKAYVSLDSVAPKVNAELDVIGADLQALGIMEKNVRAAFNLDATFEGNTENFELVSVISDGVFVYDDAPYQLGNMEIDAFVGTDTTAVSIDNNIIILKLRSNASPTDFSSALYDHYESYLVEGTRTDTIQDPVKLELRANINESPLLNEVFFADLTELDTVAIKVDFNEKDRNLSASIELPHINYAGTEIDSLTFRLDTNKDVFVFGLGFQELNAGPLAIKETIIDGSIENQNLYLDFTSFHNDKVMVHVASEISKEGDTFKVHLFPKDLILNYEEWNIPATNEAFFKDKYAEFNDFRLSRNNQLIEISDKIADVEREHVGIQFKNFELATLLNYLNPEDTLATGNLNGNFIIEEPFVNNGLLADLQINEFNVKGVPLGTLNLEAEAEGLQTYDVVMGLQGGAANLDLTGSYTAVGGAAEIDLNLILNELKVEALEGFTDEAITQGDGSISGNMNVSGSLAEPDYEGSFTFNNAAFTVATLDAPFKINNQTLSLNNDGIYFDSFTVNDATGNSFIVDGSVLTESFINPSFDLEFEAQNFQVLNSTAEDNKLYYGTAILDVTASLSGNLNIPVLDLKLNVDPKTNFTYIIPEDELMLQERDGVVIFVNRENPDAILTKNTAEETVNISGYDISALLNISEGAVLSIVLDEETGDKFQVQGEGELNFDVYPNGRTTLTGIYEINDGFYEMSLYGLVKRRFNLVDGSKVTWSGDIFDADLDLRAVYNVETSASSLMAAQTTGADASVQGKFRQELPFFVYLNIDGELLQPKISFNLDMPESEQGAVGGAVYGRIQQLNSQEQELNKQVFSLLVLNRFFPESISDGSGGGGAAGIARDNINDAISDQLNVFAENILGDSGIELDFGVDSFTDYQGSSPTERTQLNVAAQKTLLDDRLVVRVGSDVDIQGSSPVEGEGTPLIGNVSIAYLLTEDGRFRIQFFRRNEFENVIDGQLIVSGIAFIFTKEFNKFQELWDSLLFKGETTTDED
ncbi:translocation/assembly module TamB [Gillisia hiemivivida]|uniref:translocation/assembly module TamB domain-containing protein n=1 Tax=Gillisia hiemivivida TaxID=291190 RepID=UPI001FEA7BD3|nr:translocation/assembly module TamB [Gillisia hiemivivida]